MRKLGTAINLIKTTRATMTKCSKIFTFIVLLFLTFQASIAMAQPKAPWQWRFSLRGEPSGESMLVPSALYIDTEKERYYVVDSGNNRLLSFDKEGKYLKEFTANNSLQGPIDMAWDNAGHLWLVERERNAITKINLKEKKTTPFTVKHKGSTVYPRRLELDGDLFYVLDMSDGSILALDQQMNVKKQYQCPNCDSGFVDFKMRGESLWALDMQQKTVYRFDKSGQVKSKIKISDQVVFPYAIEAGSGGFIYILDRHNGNVAVFDVTGTFKYSFLGLGHVRGKLYYPVDLQLDPWGRLCIVDEGNGRVEVFGR